MPDTIAFAMRMSFPVTALKDLGALARDCAVGGPAGTGMSASSMPITRPRRNAQWTSQLWQRTSMKRHVSERKFQQYKRVMLLVELCTGKRGSFAMVSRT
jgi:predicted exporter